MANYKVSWNPVSGATGYLIEYKAEGDSSYTTPPTPPNPTLDTEYIVDLTPGVSYTIRLTSFVNGRKCTPTLKQITAAGGGSTFIWITNTYSCEQEGSFTLSNTYPNFISPANMYWEETLSKFVVVDIDDPNGLVYTINPASFAVYADRTVIAGTAGGQTRIGGDYDYDNRRVWYTGDNTSGVKVVDIVANSTTTYTFGTNGPFTRMIVKILGDNVYCGSRANSSLPMDIIIFDKNNPSFPPTTKTNASIPSGSIYLDDAFNIIKVGNELWIGAAQRGNGNVARYNLDLTTLIGVIVLPSTAVWESGLYWQSHYFDEEKNKYYVNDSGSNNLYVIDTSVPASPVIIHTQHIGNRRDRLKAVYSFTKNELTNELYFSGNDMDNTGGLNKIARTYLVDRDNFKFTYVYPNLIFGSLTHRKGTNELWGVDAGLIYTQAPALPADGSVFKFTV